MDKIFEKFMGSNKTIAESMVFISCMVLSGIAVIFVCDRKMFIEMDLFKLLLLALIPSFLVFSMLFIVFTVIIQVDEKENFTTKNILFSSIITAFYNLTSSYLIYEKIIDQNIYINSLVVFIVIGISILVRGFLTDRSRNKI